MEAGGEAAFKSAMKSFVSLFIDSLQRQVRRRLVHYALAYLLLPNGNELFIVAFNVRKRRPVVDYSRLLGGHFR
jgi:hypothetical protein